MARRAGEEVQEHRKRTISEMRRPDLNARSTRRARDSPDSGASDDRRYYPGYGPPQRTSHVSRASRPSDVGRPPQLPHRTPILYWSQNGYLSGRGRVHHRPDHDESLPRTKDSA
ncbi:hypothetical protein JVT61DRAFT_14134 [Boletus reticuloceps]|uniref:Uncharacterized protein n=1 Tax=Boletus reticuloceps TaxID=495285 RepID=A0A8I3A2V8_9AGAM|nr:hypothetical protein JVT61DRAFT_14134 [Boletus reticuloceps]